MEIIALVFMCVALIGSVCGIVVYARQLWRVSELEALVIEDIIEPSRRRLNGSNRFLISEEILREMFPEYSTAVVSEVWKRLCESRHIERDPFIESEWRVR